jgi:predicted transcriptional regulator of viral defense system
MTTQKPRDRRPTIKGTDYLLSTVLEKSLFGLKTVWRGQIKVQVSDPTRTVLDLLHNPQWGGGIRSVVDMFTIYLKSENKNLALLGDYAKRLGNGAVFKRLGFLMERYAPDELELIDACRRQLTSGNAQLDPGLNSDKLVTRWKLWLPKSWRKESPVD